MTDASPDARPFGLWTASALVVGSMIGAGIFVLPAQLAPYGWTGVVGWLVAIGGALAMGQTMSRLSAAMPQASGTLAVCAEVMGPLPGVLLGWSYWIGVWGANAIIALTGAAYLARVVPVLGASPLATALTAVALLWALTLLNLAGARAAGGFQLVATALKLLPLLAVLVILARLGATGSLALGRPSPIVPGSIAPATTLAFYALVGFESANVVAARVRNPEVNLGRATMVGAGLTGLLYLLVCTGMACALPPATLARSTAPIADFVAMFWGGWAGLGVAVFAAIACIGALNGWVLVQGDVPLGLARAGVLPRWVGRTSARDVPVPMLLVSTMLASLTVLSRASGSTAGLLTFLLQLTSASTLWLYAGACVAALMRRIARRAAALGLAFAGWALWGSGLEALGWSIVLLLTAIPLYWWARRAGAGVAPAIA